jgi:hypothetical protein
VRTLGPLVRSPRGGDWRECTEKQGREARGKKNGAAAGLAGVQVGAGRGAGLGDHGFAALPESGFHRGDEFVVEMRFVDQAEGAGGGGESVGFAVGGKGHRDNGALAGRGQRRDFGTGFDAGHAQVQQEKIGICFGDEGESFRVVAGFAGDFELGIVEEEFAYGAAQEV